MPPSSTTFPFTPRLLLFLQVKVRITLILTLLLLRVIVQLSIPLSPAPPLSHLHSLPTLPLVIACDEVLEADVVVKALDAALAFEGLLPSVDVQVRLQLAELGKGTLAHLTPEGFVVTVAQLVPLKLAKLGKFLVAHVTNVSWTHAL